MDDNEMNEMTSEKNLIDLQKSKWERVNALAQCALAGKDIPAGHRVYLRAITLLEIELGVHNSRNYEVSEGFLDSVDQLMAKNTQDDEERNE